MHMRPCTLGIEILLLRTRMMDVIVGIIKTAMVAIRKKPWSERDARMLSSTPNYVVFPCVCANAKMESPYEGIEQDRRWEGPRWPRTRMGCDWRRRHCGASSRRKWFIRADLSWDWIGMVAAIREVDLVVWP